jgi:hypothetical protein
MVGRLLTLIVAPSKKGGVVLMENDTLRGGEVVGLNPNIRIYRYSPGQFFDAHCKR